MNRDPIDFIAICNDHPVTELAAKAGVALKRSGDEWSGCCPFHNEKTPSFTVYVRGDRQRFKCFGCGATGDSIEFVRLFHGVDTKEALRILGGLTPAPIREVAPKAKADDASEKIRRAVRLYHDARPAAGTLVETYLRERRGIDLDAIGGMPPSLRCAQVTYWGKGLDRPVHLGDYPAMLAPIQNAAGTVTGVHITYLDRVTGAKLELADPENPKAFLNAKKIRGVKQGGSIRLGHGGPYLIMSEGIETALSAKVALVGTNLDGPAWTCVDLDNFAALRLPFYVTEVRFAADNDMRVPVKKNQRNPRSAIMAAAQRLAGMGVKVRIAWAEGGSDFNDMLTKGGA